MYTQISIQCTDQTLSLVDSPRIASGGVNSVKVTFSFCELWSGLEKYAVFHRKSSDRAYHVLLEEDACLVPWEVMLSKGQLEIGVLGRGEDITRPANVLTLDIEQGAIKESTEPAEPTPELYEQLLEALRENAAAVPKDAVLYTEQALTEEQQMQARKNQGLYYKDEQLVLLDDIPIVINEVYVPSDFDGSKPKNIIVEIINTSTNEILTYSCTGSTHKELNVGTNYWHGNTDLAGFYTGGAANQYPDLPFVIYHDDIGNTGHGLVIDKTLLSTIRDGKVKIYDADQTETAYVPIPKEYLPDTVATVDYVDNAITKKSVLCTEQLLTEEQQMQVRKNQGLYYSETKPEETVVYESMYVGWWETNVNLLDGNDIMNDEGVGIQYNVSFLGVQYDDLHTQVAGEIYWIGNSTLIPDDVKELGGITSEDNYPDCLFVIYQTVTDGVYSNVSLVVETNPPMGQSILVRRIGDEVTIHTLIPEEYIPGKLLPVPTEDMEGMIPQVSGGEWVTVPMPEGGEGGSAVSPTVEVTEITGGHTVKITDAEGEKTFDVMDGTNGYTPQKGVDYFDGEPGYTPVKGTDYFTDADKEELVEDVLEQVPEGGGATLRLLHTITTEENLATIEITGLNITAQVISVRIYNAGSDAGGGLNVSINGKWANSYVGTIGNTDTKIPGAKFWAWKNSDKIIGKAQMINLGINNYAWNITDEVISSLGFGSNYNDGTTKYYQAGTIVEIYEGVYPNVQ